MNRSGHSSGPGSAPELAALTRLAAALSRRADLADSLDAALATVADVLGLETGWVWLLDKDVREPRLAAARALPPALRDHPEAMHGDCYCLQTQRAGDLRGAANVNVVWCSRLERLLEDDKAATHLRCHASVPLSAGGQPIGMLNVASRDWRVLSQAELNLLTTAGALVSLVIERHRLEAASARAHTIEERNRMAREIHDTLAQSLAALTMHLEVADALVDVARDPRLRDAVNRALGLARTTLDDARRSVLELREPPLEGRSLREALQLLADQQGEVPMTFEGFAELPSLPPAVELGLYRIAQQALINIAQHARAQHAIVKISWTEQHVRLEIEDDGSGFDPALVPADRFGIVGMSERARLLGGRLSLESESGAGTTITVDVPIRATRSPE
jgi:two-component system, NarL family, sensor kinase